MPRSVHMDESGSDDDLYESPPPRTSQRYPSPSSDKENNSSRKGAKGKQPERSSRRSTGLQEIEPSQSLANQVQEEDAEEDGMDAYDPDQTIEERRAVRKGYRKLARQLEDGKSEFLKPDNNGLLDMYLGAGDLFKKVKQTSDATMDSRLLVKLSDMTHKKVSSYSIGTKALGIDIDDFVGKCVAFMKLNQRNRNHDEEVDDDAMDWAYLGREAAFKSNRRPATSDFLLGPLSVQKKIRVQKARRQGLKRRRNEEAKRPQQMQAEDIHQSENNTLKLVYKVYDILKAYFEEHEILDQGVHLLQVVVNPESFAQTVENLFYVSFLAKEGYIAIQNNEDEIPCLFLSEPATAEDHAKNRATRSQMINSITMWDWKMAIDVFDITKPMIPTRAKENTNVGANGWYA